MKKLIYKYKITSSAPLALPVGANVLKVGEQKGDICIWALFSTDQIDKLENRYFEVYGTGHSIPLDRRYYGTVFIEPFVWHIFEDINRIKPQEKDEQNETL